MNYYVSKNLKPQKLKLSLHRPNKERNKIMNIFHVHNQVLTVNFGQINELTFTLPYQVVQRNKIMDNPVMSKLREKFLVKAQYGTIEEYFIITKINKVSSESDDLNVECKSLGYQLYHRQMIDYSVVSYNCLQVTTDCVSGTGWGIGYINPNFNLKYRSFDVTSQNRLDFLNEIATTFEATIVFDTVNKLINMYKEDEISSYKGFILSYGQYLESVDETIDSDLIVTRLHVRGSDDITINSVNPTGQSYIDDFSYFLYPFEMDENGNVISSSDHMDDDLAKAVVLYNEYVTARKGEFSTLLENKTAKQSELTTAENELTVLNSELQIILDNIEVAKTQGNPTDDLISQQTAKQTEIDNKKVTIALINSEITEIDNSITQLKDDLKLDNHLNTEQIEELSHYIHEEEWSDSNIFDANDLYDASMTHIAEVNSPPVNINVGIINFYEMVTEYRNWNRLSIGDIVRIKHDKLGIEIKTKVTQIVIDIENATISLTISNSKKKQTPSSKLARLFYTVDKNDTAFNKRKTNYDAVASNFSLKNDRFSETPTRPTVTGISHTDNDNGSVNISVTWTYPDYTTTNNKADNIDGFLLYVHSETTNIPYIFGSQMAKESIVPVISSVNTYTFQSQPSNLYYTIGIKAYRVVDEDINSSGYLFSDMITFNSEPYQPTNILTIKGDVQGKLNGVTYYPPSNTAPSNPNDNDRWTDTSGSVPIDKIYVASSGEWTTSSSNSDITDLIGVANGIASLDATGNVPESQLNNVLDSIYKFNIGSYTGDDTTSKFIDVGFTPSFVKVYTTSSVDMSLFINSVDGGLKYGILTDTIYLSGDVNNEPEDSFGKLVDNGFETGNTVDAFGNKLDVKYYWEAYYIPS